MSKLIALSAVPDATKGNPFFPPASGRCLINELPTELLAHIFYIGAMEGDDDGEDYDDGDDEEEEDNDMGEVEDEQKEDEDEWEDVNEERRPIRSKNDDNHSSTSSSSYDLDFEVLVSHVCRRWRAVALDTPSLWTDLDFSEQLPYLRSRIYILRSKALPLTISMDFTDNDPRFIPDTDSDPGPPLAAAATAIEILRPHLARWRSFELMVSAYDVMYIALQLIGNIGPAPQLEVFRLYHYEDTEEYDTFMYGDQARDLNLVPFGGDAPRMRSIALWGVHIPWSGAAFLRTGGLVELELAYHTRDVRPAFVDFMNILRASPNLENLTLCLSGPAGNPADWSAEERQAALTDSTAPFVSSAAEPVVLPKLTELALSYLEPDYLTALLARLSFPALTSLAVDFEDADYSAFVQGTLAPLLSRVTAAKFSGLPCNAAAAGTALSAMSRVSSLNVNLDFLAPAWYTLLVGPPLVCPHLEALTTTGVGGREMKALVRARREQGAPLAAVYMDLEDEVGVREERWLARHVGTFERFEGSDVEDAETEGTVETDSDENLMWDGDTEVVGDHAFD